MAGERQKFIDFLARAEVRVICEVCNRNKWGIPSEGQGLGVSLMLQTSGGLTLPMPQIPVFVMVCENCGNVRLHAQAVVDREPHDG